VEVALEVDERAVLPELLSSLLFGDYVAGLRQQDHRI